jgi:hypothetical protein
VTNNGHNLNSVEKTNVAERSPVRPEPEDLSEELNPLLNPVLEQNLSSWAQIYFTTPPASRDQAVRDLLRKLHVDMNPNVPKPAPPPAQNPMPRVDDTVSRQLICSTCHSENPSDQQFCGFCGTALLAKRTVQETVRPVNPPAAASYSQPAETMSFLGLDSNQPDEDLQFLREKTLRSKYYEEDTASSHLGRYAFATIVLILAGLAYVEWPFLQSKFDSISRTSSSARSSPNGTMPAAPSQPSPVIPTEAQQPATTETQPQKNATPTPTDQRTIEASNGVDRGESIPPAPPVALAAHKDATPPAAEGTQELLEAQRYLDGRGVPHDSGVAASLLWKAVGKENARADVLLAELYLRGDGVPKSCDQARLLLVAAAKKKAPGVADGLRTLESTCR